MKDISIGLACICAFILWRSVELYFRSRKSTRWIERDNARIVSNLIPVVAALLAVFLLIFTFSEK